MLFFWDSCMHGEPSCCALSHAERLRIGLRREMLCCAQLYNEEVNDLLAQDNTKLQIHESREAGIYVAGLREEIVTSCEHVLQLLEEGDRLRHVGETKMNKASSRSHSTFRMVRRPQARAPRSVPPHTLPSIPWHLTGTTTVWRGETPQAAGDR